MGIVLFVTILAAAFTTLNSLMHLLSTTVSNDLLKKENKNMGIISMLMVIFFAVLMSIIYENQPAFISRSTAVYFSLLGGSMLPSLIAMIRGQQNTNAAIWSIILGSLTSLFWLFFVHFKESKLFTGITIDLGKINFVETIVPTLLVSFLTYFIFSKIKQNV
jgi:SSS family solute:Na+ symporter